MRNCALCEQERDDVEAVEVLPATWNKFNNFAEVCVECQGTRRFKTWRKPASRVRAAAAASAALLAAAASGAPVVETIACSIAHRHTGAVLHTVAALTLAGANLAGAALGGATLRHAALSGADLRRADLHLADLVGADLRGADLRAASFRGADLSGADLREARLGQADLRQCLYDRATRWPVAFDPGTSGALRNGRG